MAKVKFRYLRLFRTVDFWKKAEIKEKDTIDNNYISQNYIMDALRDLQSMCEAGDYKLTYYLKPHKDHRNGSGKLWVSVKRMSRLVQRPNKMSIVKIVLHKLEDVLDLRW